MSTAVRVDQERLQHTLVHDKVTLGPITELDTDTEDAAGTYKMGVNEFTVICETETNDKDFIIELPDVEETAGNFYVIYMTDHHAGEDVTITDGQPNTPIGVFKTAATIVLDAADDYIIVYSDGYVYHEVVDGYT